MKQHETSTDLKREQNVIEQVCKWSNSEYVKLPKQYRADYALHRMNEVVSLVEVKGRSAEFGKFQNVFIAAHKRAEVLMLADAMNVKAFVVFAHPNGLYLLDLDVEPDGCRLIQDSRNRDDRDFEPCVYWHSGFVRKIADGDFFNVNKSC